MSRILTGIQSTGVPHLGNILGAIMPAIELSKDPKNDCLFFIADLHALTTVKDPELIRHNNYAVAASWLAFGFDTEKNIFYRQSDVAEVCELQWYLNCLTPYPMLANAHSFKDKSEKLSDVNAGLFTYPVLMSADILLYDAEIIPVGKDQEQHLEMTRDIAGSFNHKFGDTLVIPEAKFHKETMYVPGTDGGKMSKSYNNFIDIFLSDKKLRKQIMGIVTDSKGVDDAKDPETCNVFGLYKILASPEQIVAMRDKYTQSNAGYGYGHAKQELFELIVAKFEKERIKFNELMEDKALLDSELKKGAVKARVIAIEVLRRVRSKMGFN
ncbi:MAG: tryptophan--tRNA ligase [Flavobacteriales bacterium]|nr:tryptophan--tRNA ligase [Flavobacteriales bacterium]